MSRRQILFLSRLLKIDSQAVVDMFNGLDTRLSVEQRIREILIGYIAAKKASKIVETIIVLPEVKLDCIDFMDQERKRISTFKRTYKDQVNYDFYKGVADILLNLKNR